MGWQRKQSDCNILPMVWRELFPLVHTAKCCSQQLCFGSISAPKNFHGDDAEMLQLVTAVTEHF